LILEVAEGVRYLHNRKIVHGDIKGTNVLVSVIENIPLPLLYDFGLSFKEGVSGDTTEIEYTLPYTAPELLDDSLTNGLNSAKTSASDVWSLGMTAYEIFTGNPPFYERNNNHRSLSRDISAGYLPLMPDDEAIKRGLSSSVWAILLSCWKPDPALRPTIEEVIDKLAYCGHSTS